jgi:serralysin
MASFRNVPGSGYGNVYVNSLVWGGTAWDPSGGPIKVFFGEPADFEAAVSLHGQSDYLSSGTAAFGWSGHEIEAFIYACNLYRSVCGLTFQLASQVEEADVVWWKTSLGASDLGAHEIPDGGRIWGYFDPTKPSWSNMHFGGDGLNTVLHEIGHGLGLAHPHDGGDPWTGTTFPGVFDAFSIGDYGLNQGVWTIMSYNSGWEGAGYNLAYGNQGGLGAFDIAGLQALYGVNYTTAAADDVYELPTRSGALGEAGWSCIWDAGGIDTITAAPGAGGVVIDLRPATLRTGHPNAGGYISMETSVAGGFTIAKGVTIENATGGSRGDELIGNRAANTLVGNGGNDLLWGDGGNDLLRGGAGRDTFVFDVKPHKSANRDTIADYNVASDTIWLDNKVFAKLGKGSYDKPAKFNADMFVKGSKPKDREDYIVYDSNKGLLSYDADGSGSKSKMVEIATLQKGLNMTYQEFYVV